MSDPESFKKCSTCKQPLAFGEKYWACSVSTCNRPKLALYFCSLPCWEAHVPEMRHRDAWAEERRAPTLEAYLREQRPVEVVGRSAELPRRAKVVGASATEPGSGSSPSAEGEPDVLVVVSKLKRYIKDRSDMNTSDNVVGIISDHIRALAREAIHNAAADGRKTVMDRDFPPASPFRR